MADQDLILSDLTGGRNGVDAPTSEKFPFDQCVEAQNVDFRNGGLGRRRGGCYDVTGNTTQDPTYPMSTPILTLIRHTPGGVETTNQIFAFETTPAFRSGRLQPPSTQWTVNEFWASPSGSTEQVVGVSFNGKLFLFYDSASDRLKVFDPALPNGGQIRNVGLAAPTAAPGVANTGSGSYAAVLRWYRVRFGTYGYTRVSEPSPAVSFTPSGTGLAARVSKPASVDVGEKETVWIVEGSPDNSNWYVLATLDVATTIWDDTIAVSQYPSYPLSQVLGTFTLVPSARFGCTDGNRLIIANIFEQGKGSRVMWTPVLGSLDKGDDERLYQTAILKPYLDLDEKNGGDITGISQINGVIYVFKWRQVWRLTPTGDIFAPYQARRLAGTVGALSHKSIALGEDAQGQPALYFMSQKGPYRVGPNGLEYCGRDLEDLTRTFGLPNINTTATVISHGVFHFDQFQYWVWFSTGSNSTPNELCVLDAKKATRQDEYGVRGGWSRFTGLLAQAVCSCMGPYGLVTTAALRPWVGLPGNLNIAIADQHNVFTDKGTTYQALVTTRSVAAFGKLLRIGETTLVARHGYTGAVALRETLISDFGRETTTADLSIDAAFQNMTVVRRFDAATMADAASVQIQLGDPSATSTQWELRQLKVPVFVGGEV